MERDPALLWEDLSRIARAGHVQELRAAVMTAFDRIGFRAAYFLAPIVMNPDDGRVLTNIGFPEEWAENYRSQGFRDDPLPTIAMSRNSAFFWPSGLEHEDLSPRQRDYLASIERHGMGQGIAVPCFGPFARTGFVGVGLPDGAVRFSEETRIQVEVCARLSFQRYSRLAQPFENVAPALSPRELEVLRWISEGKSNPVIAQLLEISPATVDVYVGRIFEKLGVADRTSAAVKALAMGMIVAGAYPQAPR